MKNVFLLVVLGSALALPACETAKPFRIHGMPARKAPADMPAGLEKLLADPPVVSWERAPKNAAPTDYWAMPGEEPFYLFRDGIQFIGAESALRYVLTQRGFDLLTVEEKQAIKNHPICPSFAPLLQCIDNHTLLIVTHISCGSAACDYDFVIIDYFNKIPFANDPPVIKEIIDYILDDRQEESYFPFRLARSFNERHRSKGNITAENPLWVDFISSHFETIRKRIDDAVARGEIRLSDRS